MTEPHFVRKSFREIVFWWVRLSEWEQIGVASVVVVVAAVLVVVYHL